MKIRFEEDLIKKLGKIRKSNSLLFKKIDLALGVFRENPRHASLRLHKLSGTMKNSWSLSVGMGYRLIFVWIDDEAYFVDMGTHNEVYRKRN